MLCPYCNASRLADAVPCPRCGAPSPFSVAPIDNYGAQSSRLPGGQVSPIPTQGAWGNQAFPFSASSGQQSVNDNSLWAQVMAPQVMQASPQPGSGNPNNPPSLLPVPYQGGGALQQQYMGGALVPTQSQGASLVPVYPGEEESIHIAPMYTKPRAIIPRYRAISGLLSVLIVMTLLCAGTAYYAKQSGKLAFLHHFYGETRPKNVKASPTAPLVPLKTQPDYGPAANVINSATTADKIDAQTDVALDSTYIFKTGQPIYLTYSVQPRAPGSITLKWYTNNVLYQTSSPIRIQDPKSGLTVMQYPQPVQGTVELYWNNQLAMRLYFVVR